jgi:hypothetical protein
LEWSHEIQKCLKEFLGGGSSEGNDLCLDCGDFLDGYNFKTNLKQVHIFLCKLCLRMVVLNQKAMYKDGFFPEPVSPVLQKQSLYPALLSVSRWPKCGEGQSLSA